MAKDDNRIDSLKREERMSVKEEINAEIVKDDAIANIVQDESTEVFVEGKIVKEVKDKYSTEWVEDEACKG